MTIVLDNDQVEHLLTMELCLEALDQAYKDLGEGTAVNARRQDIYVNLPDPGPEPLTHCFKTMSGAVPSMGVSCVRLDSDLLSWPEVDGKRRRVQIPAASGRCYTGLVLLFSTRTTEPLMIFPDAYIQKMRVGAASGLAAKYLAPEEVENMALIGSGLQAGAQLQAFRAVRNIKRVKVYSPSAERRQQFAAEWSRKLNIEVEPVATAAAAVAGAEIVNCATSSMDPVLDPAWIKEGLHFTTVKKQEAPEEYFRRCDPVVLHSRQQAHHEDFLGRGAENIPEVEQGWWTQLDSIGWDRYPELCEVICGRHPGRTKPGQVTFFMNNIGMGIQFAAVGAKLYEKARAAALGEEIPTGWLTQKTHG